MGGTRRNSGAAVVAEVEVRVNTRLPKGTVRTKSLGFNKRPTEDIIDGTFECSKVLKSKATGFEFVTLKIKGPSIDFPRSWSPGELAGLTKGPVVTLEDGDLGVNENMLVTWTSDMEEPEFNAPQ